MPKMTCKRDYIMENGALAFLAGHEYEMRWATPEEEKEQECMYVFSSEIADNHFMSYSSVEEAFGE